MFADLLKKIQGFFGGGEAQQGGYNAEEGVYYAKGSFEDEVEYNNEIICINNITQDWMAAMNDAMEAQDYQRAEQVRQAWISGTPQQIEKLKKLGDYHGNSALKDQAIKYFNDLQGLMQTGYKTLIELRMAGKRGTPEEQAQLEDNNDKLKDFAEEFDQVSERFLEARGMIETGAFDNPFDHVKHDENNPLLAPVSGVSLQDYAAAAAHLANGGSEAQVCQILGVSQAAWAEANRVWTERMQQDGSMTVATLYGRYFGSSTTHPKFAAVRPEPASDQVDYLVQLRNDERFYYELCGARLAAYEAGLDGAQWIEQTYGIALGDFQTVAMKWSAKVDNIKAMMEYQEQKQREYAAKFAQQRG